MIRGAAPLITGLVVSAVVSVATLTTAVAGTVSGLVYVDEDGSGTPSPGEPGLAGAAVYWETSVRAVTDSAGRFSMEVPDRDGMIWARATDAIIPTPVWAVIAGGSGAADLGVVRAAADRRPAFIQASDTHMGKTEVGLDRRFSAVDLIDALDQAIDPDRPPMFFAITGDVASGARAEHYESILEATSQISVPFVPVPGNHDWYDSGENYRRYLGPPMYSFIAGGARFVVLNDNGDTAAWRDFLALDLADADPGAQVIAFIHRPPDDAALDLLDAAGVDVLLSGHWHSNMVIERGNLLELNTQPLYSGGIDTTPGGYRIVELLDPAEGGVEIRHHNTVNRGHARVVFPRGEICGRGGDLELFAAVELGDGATEVTATIGSRSLALEPAGGWVYRASLGPMTGGTIRLTARRGVDVVSDEVAFATVACEAPTEIAAWPQLQGNAANTGYSPRRIEAPLATLWATAVGGHVHGGSPVVSDDRVFVSIADFAAADSGGLVALDLATGAELWRRETGAAVRNAAAVYEDVVVIGRADGVVEALAVDSGELRWSRDLGLGLTRNTSLLHAAPTVAAGVVYVGVHRRYTALDARTGEVIWQRDPAEGLTLSSLAAAAVRGDLVVGTVARGSSGMFAWARTDAAERWRTSAATAVGVHASPVIDADTVYIANATGDVIAVDLATAEPRWATNLVEAGPWDYAIIATPALSDGRLFVPTQYDRIAALDTGSGEVLWTLKTGESALRPTHTRTVTGAAGASPIIAGDILWVGAADGMLRAVDPRDGDQLWRADLGSPITSGLAAAGDVLVVATYDGTVRALVQHGELPEPSGCGCASGGSGGAALLLLVGLAVWLFRRRSR